MILVTGAAGKTGLAVIKRLVAKGQRVRGLVRRQEQATELKQLGAAEFVVGDIGNRVTLDQAAQGARAIYHICPNMYPDEASVGKNVIGAAQAAGIERFVYHSVLHPQIEVMPHHWQKMRVEEMLFESGMACTILQPAAYMQNVLANWDHIVEQGEHVVPYGLETRLSMVDLLDVAEVAANVLTDADHDGATYELCANEIYSQNEIAKIIASHLGRSVRGVVVTLDAWEREARCAVSHGGVRLCQESFAVTGETPCDPT